MYNFSVQAFVPKSSEIDPTWQAAYLAYYANFDLGLPVSVLLAYAQDDWRLLRSNIISALALFVQNEGAVSPSQPELAGFLLYQIDQEASDWCESPGDGFIRECYVAPPYRGQGLGSQLYLEAEKALIQLGVGRIYLSSDDSQAFWESLGFRFTGRYARKNGDPLLEKYV